MDEEQEKALTLLESKLEERVLKSRRIFLSTAVTDESARDIIRRLWCLELESPGTPILFVINSPGGSVDAGLAIWDQIQMISSPVCTLVTGIAASMGSVLCVSGAKGHRLITRFARVMVHQPAIHREVIGRSTELDIQAMEMLRTLDLLVDLYVEHTGQQAEEIRKALDRDTWMSAQQALEFGLVDQIVNSFEEVENHLRALGK